MNCTVVVLPSEPALRVALGVAKREVATGGEMSRVGIGSDGAVTTTGS